MSINWSKSVMDRECALCEKDIPGASLNGRKPNVLKVPELKRCRGASVRGEKADLVLR